MTTQAHSGSTADIALFNSLAHGWWDDKGDMRLLHRMNPVRFGYVQTRTRLAGRRCLDVGCGGGILSESLAREATHVTGIDLAPDVLEVARLHAIESNLSNVRYLQMDAGALAAAEPGSFAVVTCMEMLEHVPDPAAVIMACAALAERGGDLFFSTINRTGPAWAVAVLGAEHVARLLPRGTHRFDDFIKPAELESWGRAAGLELADLAGLQFNLARGDFQLGQDVNVNYLAHFRRPA